MDPGKVKQILEKLDSIIGANIDVCKGFQKFRVETEKFKVRVIMTLDQNSATLARHQKRSDANEQATSLLKEETDLLKASIAETQAKWRGMVIGVVSAWTILTAAIHIAIRLWP